ncbi:20143_t:CDS:1, partial [Funneliformis geosporum]
MSDKSDNFVFIDCHPSITTKKKKPNMFILYRTEMLKYKPYNITMTEFSKMMSKEWRELPDYEKSKWQKYYHIIRDQQLQINTSGSPIEHLDENPTSAANPNLLTYLP